MTKREFVGVSIFLVFVVVLVLTFAASNREFDQNVEMLATQRQYQVNLTATHEAAPPNRQGG